MNRRLVQKSANAVEALAELIGVAVEATLMATSQPDYDLVGVAEVAEILGVTKQNVSHLAKSGSTFPEPIAQLRATPVWRRRDIERFAERRRLKKSAG